MAEVGPTHRTCLDVRVSRKEARRGDAGSRNTPDDVLTHAAARSQRRERCAESHIAFIPKAKYDSMTGQPVVRDTMEGVPITVDSIRKDGSAVCSRSRRSCRSVLEPTTSQMVVVGTVRSFGDEHRRPRVVPATTTRNVRERSSMRWQAAPAHEARAVNHARRREAPVLGEPIEDFAVDENDTASSEPCAGRSKLTRAKSSAIYRPPQPRERNRADEDFHAVRRCAARVVCTRRARVARSARST
jgi:hypothetical protein